MSAKKRQKNLSLKHQKSSERLNNWCVGKNLWRFLEINNVGYLLKLVIRQICGLGKVDLVNWVASHSVNQISGLQVIFVK